MFGSIDIKFVNCPLMRHPLLLLFYPVTHRGGSVNFFCLSTSGHIHSTGTVKLHQRQARTDYVHYDRFHYVWVPLRYALQEGFVHTVMENHSCIERCPDYSMILANENSIYIFFSFTPIENLDLFKSLYRMNILNVMKL